MSTPATYQNGQDFGRPSIYTQEIADEICADLAEGKSLRSIVRDKPDVMPHMVTILRWLRVHEDFRSQYALSKEESADALADDIQFIADEAMNGRIDPNAARVAVDAKKWVAAKLKPRKYGDKLDLTSDGKPLPAPIFGGQAVRIIDNIPEATLGDEPSAKNTELLSTANED